MAFVFCSPAIIIDIIIINVYANEYTALIKVYCCMYLHTSDITGHMLFGSIFHVPVFMVDNTGFTV